MYVLLPDESTSLSGLLDELLTPDNWASWLARLVDRQGEIRLPRLEVSCTLELRDVFGILGMATAFDPKRANFEAMCACSAFVDRVSHRASIQVDEEGTQASAETVVEVTIGGNFLADGAFQMVVDRPFFYAIQDDLSGMPIFLGLTIDAAPLTSTTWAQRQRESLLDALSLIAIGMDEGLSLEQAIGKVYEQWNNELALAFGRVLQEIQLGKPRRDAMKDMAKHMDNPDLTLFVNALIQADQAGEDLREVVHAQAQRLRANYPK
jgi:hypothetical protein